MKVEWVTGIQRQCESACVPFFFKQWGGTRKCITGRELNGRTYDEQPTLTTTPVPTLEERRQLMARFTDVWPVPRAKGKRTA
ncbi:MAG: phage Gp37/Gp68 family protein [Thermoguttaceae bacterium]|nr:phage Gp37/Gp68 family protein [Thermoguttaceae bacterium]